ncbi:MAG: hypothetical protein JRF72_13845 [Deltaproteobacteria bacterium]|jgi:uroporphyrinogen decarboxylase|nr:hypothetical protein [Deltaproteobacteria bacterium]
MGKPDIPVQQKTGRIASWRRDRKSWPPWNYHSDGDLGRIFDDLSTLGMNGFNPFQPPVMDIEKYKTDYGDRICPWGSIDLVYTLSHGTVEEVDAEVKQRIQKLAPGGGYILASANSITEFCKSENTLALAEAKDKTGWYPINLRDRF